jgi:hypothetical protein
MKSQHTTTAEGIKERKSHKISSAHLTTKWSIRDEAIRFPQDCAKPRNGGGRLTHGADDFRVGGRIFATLAAEDKGYGNLMLSPELQAQSVQELPEVFLPIPGGWGRMGSTHIRPAKANEEVLSGALRTAWKLRVEKNTGTKKKRAPRSG